MQIQIQHFTLTAFNTQESAAFYGLVDANRSRLEDYFAGTVGFTKTPEAAHQYCIQMEQRRLEKTYFPFVLKDKTTGNLVAWIDVKNIDWRIPKAEIGYFIDKEHEGQGLTSQAVSHVVKHIVEEYGFRKLLCRVNDRNTGSIHVALKSGFELEGTIRRDYKTTKGEVVDLNYYGRLF
ncbi:MAG: GNAT family N-acetyltransferase [Bacteroidia bacterium]